MNRSLWYTAANASEPTDLSANGSEVSPLVRKLGARGSQTASKQASPRYTTPTANYSIRDLQAAALRYTPVHESPGPALDYQDGAHF